MHHPVSYLCENAIGHVVIDAPPLNVLSSAVRQGLLGSLKEALADDEARAIILRCQGRSFIAGGDITEFGAAIEPPDVNEITALIEESSKPVVAALYGTVLGGGLELALACHGRVALPDCRFGLPEVSLGLIPGAGGTYRLPRLVGLKEALALMTSGAPISAEQALSLGLIDVISADLTGAATAEAQRLLEQGHWTRCVSKMPVRDSEEVGAIATAARASLAPRLSWSEAREAVIAQTVAGLDLPLQAALVAERATFEALIDTPQCRALRHMFFAERKAVALPPTIAAAPTREIARAGVLGSGTMGRGIAIVLLQAGLEVTLCDKDAEALARAERYLDDHFAKLTARGQLSDEAATDIASRIRYSTVLSDFAQADLIIEAIFEERAVKRAAFSELDTIAKKGAILATNTSSLQVLDIAQATSRPEDVVGLHFFSPAHLMPLLEIVRTSATSNDVIHTAMRLSKRLRKTGVLVGDCFGFTANRMVFEYQRQSEFLVEEGATPAQVDRVMREYGLPMGPFELFDMAGLDVGWRIRKDWAVLRDPDRRYSILNDLVCEAGWFGQKTGKGWYLHGKNPAERRENPDLAPLLTQARAVAGITPRMVSDDEILQRCLYALVNEGAKILGEGLIERASDIDVIYVAGFGYPRWRGGPMHAAEAQGLDRVLKSVEEFARQDPNWWMPAPLLRRAVEQGVGFDEIRGERA